MPQKRIAANTVYQLLTRIISSGIGLFITFLIAGYLHLGGYGEFTTITTFVGLFYLLLDFGLNAIFLQHEITPQRFLSLFYFRILLALVLIIIVNTIAFLLPDRTVFGGFTSQTRLGIAIFSLTLLFQSIQLSASSLFQKNLRYDFSLWATLGGSIATCLVIIGFITLSYPLPSLLVAYGIGAAVTAGLMLYFIKQPLTPITIDKSFITQITINSLPLGLMLLCNLIYFRIDVMLLSLLRTPIDVGIYGYAYKFFDFFIAVPLFLSNSLYPLLLQSSKNSQKFLLVIRKYMPIFIGLSFLIVIPAWILAPLIAWVRPEFIESVSPFRILLLSLPFFFATSLLQWVLITLKQQKYLFYIYAISTVFNILLNIWFIPVASYHASAIITGVSEALVFGLLVVKFMWAQKNMQHGR